MRLGPIIALGTLVTLGLLSLVNMACPSKVTSSERKADSLGFLVAALLALLLVGCQTAPAPAAGPIPPATVAAAALCEPPPDLSVPVAANSAQLEAALYAAYLALRAQYLQCLTTTHKDVP